MTSEYTYNITVDFDTPFYTGVGTSADVPGTWDVAINGHGFMLDTSHPSFGGQSAYLGRMGIETIPLIRNQANNSSEPGESSINQEDLWPRVQTSWHKGAGQLYFDRPDSDRQRFRASLGVDCWTRGQLKLLNDITQILSSANTNLQSLLVGQYLYYADGNNVKFFASPYTSPTDSVIQAGESAQSVKSICSDGKNVYAALGSNGIHKTVRAATSTTHYSDLSATLVRYVKGRLMAANGASIYNVVASGAAPSALFTHGNSDFSWVGFAEGTGQIYAAGFSGDKSLIYRTAVKTDGTSLDAPVVAGELPDGEIVYSINGYLGFIQIGTNLGYRLATANNAGDLTLGALQQTNTVVRDFEGQDRFVWFGWENYSSARTGLGRMDLTVQTDSGASAFASDLMAGTDAAPIQGAVTSVSTDANGNRVFCVSGEGIYVESNVPVESGSIDSGQMDYGIPDPKIALRMLLKHKPLDTGASVTVYVEPDDGDLVFVGVSDQTTTTSTDQAMKVPEVSAQLFEIHLVLAGDVVLEMADFRSYPASTRGKEIHVPILLYETVTNATGSEQTVDIRGEYDTIESYIGTRKLISYQELGVTYSAFIEDVDFQRHHPTQNRRWWNGTLLVVLKVLGD